MYEHCIPVCIFESDGQYLKYQQFLKTAKKDGTFIQFSSRQKGCRSPPKIIVHRLKPGVTHPDYLRFVRLNWQPPCDCLKYDLICLEKCSTRALQECKNSSVDGHPLIHHSLPTQSTPEKSISGKGTMAEDAEDNPFAGPALQENDKKNPLTSRNGPLPTQPSDESGIPQEPSSSDSESDHKQKRRSKKKRGLLESLPAMTKKGPKKKLSQCSSTN